MVRQSAFDLHCHLRHGHLEKVYENCLIHRLQQKNIATLQQHPVNVHDSDGTVLGEYFIDIFVENSIIVELKTCKTLASEHEQQLIGYLRACQIRHGLLINFGSPTLQIRKLVF